MRSLAWRAGAPVRAVLIGLIHLYRVTLSGTMGGQCRFAPSCSHYAEDAIRARGAIRGTGLAASVLPVLTLAIPLAGFLGQSTRDEFERELEQPFVTSARARGMSDTGVRLRHVLRHAVLPAVTLSGWALGALLSGAVIVESVFSRPGLGQVLVSAVNARDLPVVSGVVIFVALVYVVANVLVDLAYTLIDPRMRAS